MWVCTVDDWFTRQDEAVQNSFIALSGNQAHPKSQSVRCWLFTEEPRVRYRMRTFENRCERNGNGPYCLASFLDFFLASHHSAVVPHSATPQTVVRGSPDRSAYYLLLVSELAGVHF